MGPSALVHTAVLNGAGPLGINPEALVRRCSMHLATQHSMLLAFTAIYSGAWGDSVVPVTPTSCATLSKSQEQTNPRQGRAVHTGPSSLDVTGFRTAITINRVRIVASFVVISCAVPTPRCRKDPDRNLHRKDAAGIAKNRHSHA